MGVKGLWKILAPSRQLVGLEALEGKKMAIDVSFWMYQFLRMAPSPGSSEAFLVAGVFHRLCKLVFAGISPVLVFDGRSVPALKRETLMKRRRLRDSESARANKILARWFMAKVKEAPSPAEPGHPQSLSAVSPEPCLAEHVSSGDTDCALLLVEPFSEAFSRLSPQDQQRILLYHKFSRHQQHAWSDAIESSAEMFSLDQIQRASRKGKIIRALDELRQRLNPASFGSLVAMSEAAASPSLVSVYNGIFRAPCDADEASASREPPLATLGAPEELSFDALSDMPLALSRGTPAPGSAGCSFQPDVPTDAEAVLSSHASGEDAASSLSEDGDETFEEVPMHHPGSSSSLAPFGADAAAAPGCPGRAAALLPYPKAYLPSQPSPPYVDVLPGGSKELPSSQPSSAILREYQSRMASTEAPSGDHGRLVKELAGLFGIACVDAPMEAEAQCVSLALDGAVDAVASDDSDAIVFAFCSRLPIDVTVYRNLFKRDADIERFSIQAIEEELGLSAETVLSLVYLLGSDYNEGIAGVGPVSAMEILSRFPRADAFLAWIADGGTGPPDDPILNRLRSSVFPSSFPPAFPDPRVRAAFENPAVLGRAGDFKLVSGREISLQGLVDFMKEHAGWDRDKTSRFLAPVLRKLGAQRAKPIRSYFPSVQRRAPETPASSGRLGRAIKRMKSAR